MPEFHLDTAGEVYRKGSILSGADTDKAFLAWGDVDDLAQGYITAMFFTAGDEPGTFDGQLCGFEDLDPGTLSAILADCAAFQATCAPALAAAQEVPGYGPGEERGPRGDDTWEAMAGRDFWYTRNGHGCGFWDGDWPEPSASYLDQAARGFRSLDAYLGDDGRVYLS